jgi:uncharacterized protein YjbJ (UPF0337 family)
MSSRIDEFKGKLKQGVGGLTGNDDMVREGEAEATRAKAERQAEGMVDQTVGKAQEKVGEVTTDSETETEGQARQVKGDIERAG